MNSDSSRAERLSKILQGIDLTSADGRAGMRTLLREVESLSPGMIESEAARLTLTRLGITVR